MKCILHIIRKRQTLSGCFFPHLVNFQFSFPETHFFFFFKAKVTLLTTVPVLILEGKTTLIIELVLVYFRSYSSFLLFSLYSFSHFSYFALPYILFFYFALPYILFFYFFFLFSLAFLIFCFLFFLICSNSKEPHRKR